MKEGAALFSAALLPQGLDTAITEGTMNLKVYQDILQDNVRIATSKLQALERLGAKTIQ